MKSFGNRAVGLTIASRPTPISPPFLHQATSLGLTSLATLSHSFIYKNEF